MVFDVLVVHIKKNNNSESMNAFVYWYYTEMKTDEGCGAIAFNLNIYGFLLNWKIKSKKENVFIFSQSTKKETTNKQKRKSK